MTKGCHTHRSTFRVHSPSRSHDQGSRSNAQGSLHVIVPPLLSWMTEGWYTHRSTFGVHSPSRSHAQCSRSNAQGSLHVMVRLTAGAPPTLPIFCFYACAFFHFGTGLLDGRDQNLASWIDHSAALKLTHLECCLLYTSPSPRDS